MFYKIFASRDRNIQQSIATCRCVVLLSSASAVTKARERKGEEKQRRLIFYKIFTLRNRNIRQSVATYRCEVLLVL